MPKPPSHPQTQCKQSPWYIQAPCYHCLAPTSQWLCSRCIAQLPTAHNACHGCALPSPSSPCATCLKTPMPFQAALTAFWYLPPLNTLVRQLKQTTPLPILQLLTPVLMQKIDAHYPSKALPDVIVPTPTHWLKKLRRGFHPSMALAQTLSRQLGIPTASVLRQHKFTPPQKSLNKPQRLKNLQGAFSIPPRHAAKIAGRHLALVDDVITTCATATALSECLLAAGAKQVDVWALARTP